MSPDVPDVPDIREVAELPEPAEPPDVHTIPRRYVALGLIVLAIVLVGALILIRNVNQSSTTSDIETITPAPSSMVTGLAQIPAAVVNAVGAASPDSPVTPPIATGNSSVWEAAGRGTGARPVVFFYGAEFAPYAAAERWPLIVALSRFGTFGQLGLMQSSTSVAFGNTSTFSFWQATYSSVWVDLQAVERYSSLNPTGVGYTSLQVPTPRQTASVAVYDTSPTTFPLLDIANHYVLVGSSYSPSVLNGLSQEQVVADLAVPTSPVTQAIMASANEITASICSVTGQRPVAVCAARGVHAADARMGIHPAG
jgi:hypothetical protein